MEQLINQLPNSIIYYTIGLSIFITTYYLLSKRSFYIRSSLLILISAALPILLDILIPLSSFTFNISSYSYTTTRGALTLNLLDYIFSYKLFSLISTPIVSPFIESAQSISSSFLITTILFLSTSTDSILEFIFFTTLIYTILTLIEDKLKFQIKYQLPISLIFGSIPIFIYSYYVSNPFNETDKLIKTYNGISSFLSSSDASSILIVIISLLINFALITIILLSIIDLILSIYGKVNYSTRPEYLFDYSGIAIIYALIYSSVFMLHTSYKWYIILPAFALYTPVKSIISTSLSNRKAIRNERDTISRISQQTIETLHGAPKRDNMIHDEFSSKNVAIALIILSLILIIYWIALK